MYSAANRGEKQTLRRKENRRMQDRKEFVPGTMGDRIAYLRKRKKLTQAQLAEQLGISAQAVSKWESGISCPDIMTLVPLSQVLEVSTDELLGLQSGNASHSNNTYGDANEAGVPRQEGPEVNFTMGSEDSGERETERKRESEQTRDPEQTGFQSLLAIPARDDGMHSISELIVGAGACAAVIRSGNDFGLETEGYQEGDIISEVSGGIWTVRDIADKNILRIGRNTFSKRKMIITIPQGYHFDKVKLNIGAGTLTGAGITAGESTLSVGAGQVTMKDFISYASKITCGMGEIVVRGELYGKCSVDCGMGSVRLYIKEPEHYGYRTSVGMGEVRIGDNRLSGIGGSQTMNAGDSNFYKVSCSMGMVSVAFTDWDA